MAEWFVGPIMAKLIDACSECLQDQFRLQTGVKEELERLRENQPKIQAFVSAATEAQIIDQNLALNKWIWQLRDAIDEVDDALDDIEYTKHEEQLAKNLEETKKRSVGSLLSGIAQKLRRIGEPALKIDPNLARLEEVVQKLDKVSAEVSTFLPLLESTKEVEQEQQIELYRTHETGSLPKNDLIGQGIAKSENLTFLLLRLRSYQKVTLVFPLAGAADVAAGAAAAADCIAAAVDRTRRSILNKASGRKPRVTLAVSLFFFSMVQVRLETKGETMTKMELVRCLMMASDDIWGEY